METTILTILDVNVLCCELRSSMYISLYVFQLASMYSNSYYVFPRIKLISSGKLAEAPTSRPMKIDWSNMRVYHFAPPEKMETHSKQHLKGEVPHFQAR